VAANLSDSLKNGNFTVFAPTNGAFSKLPSETLNSLLKPENKQQLVNILSYHVIEGKVSFADLKTKTSVKTLLNQDVKVKVVGEDIFLNDMVKITTSDVEASNGVAHIIDSVLIPKAGSDNTSVQASPNQASVPTLSQAINSTPELSTLKELVTIAGIDANTLNNVTVFAPTNDAFGKLPASLVSYLKHNPAVLKEVILNHILSQKLDSQSVLQFLASSEEPVTNLQNQLLSLSIKNQQIYVNSSKVVATDINTTNGLVHLVDKVIL
jgi:transforming growth factor-beta-induced protein